MRCPKCGYTSFDKQERCPKCKKNIVAATAAFVGTVVNATPPAFLCIVVPEQEAGHAVAATDNDIGLDIDNDGQEYSSAGDELFCLSDHEQTEEILRPFTELPDDAIDLRLTDSFDASSAMQQEPALNLELELAVDDVSLPSAETKTDIKSTFLPGLGLRELDLSDLQAPQVGSSRAVGIEPAQGLDDTDAAVKIASPGSASAGAQNFSLENLLLEGIEDKPATSVSDATYQPSVKTGTALDNFNFGLDELLVVDENEKT
ncbi:MAG: hypothetical protein GX087_10230 [Desulfobulbaceae bacterium]|nr:hypothetical protein [Desulfobulbaceae bacterium]